MAKSAAEILLAFPPRSLDPNERALVVEWSARSGDLLLVYVSQRRSDDPAFFRRVVIKTEARDQPAYLIHAPAGTRLWLKLTLIENPRSEMFDSLATALNSIRNVLP